MTTYKHEMPITPILSPPELEFWGNLDDIEPPPVVRRSILPDSVIVDLTDFLKSLGDLEPRTLDFQWVVTEEDALSSASTVEADEMV
jgi:hypothetical protein